MVAADALGPTIKAEANNKTDAFLGIVLILFFGNLFLINPEIMLKLRHVNKFSRNFSKHLYLKRLRPTTTTDAPVVSLGYWRFRLTSKFNDDGAE